MRQVYECAEGRGWDINRWRTGVRGTERNYFTCGTPHPPSKRISCQRVSFRNAIPRGDNRYPVSRLSVRPRFFSFRTLGLKRSLVWPMSPHKSPARTPGSANHFQRAHCPWPIDGMGIEFQQAFAQFAMGIIGEPCITAQCNSRIGTQWPQFNSIDFTFAALAQFRQQFRKGPISCSSRIFLRDLGHGYLLD